VAWSGGGVERGTAQINIIGKRGAPSGVEWGGCACVCRGARFVEVVAVVVVVVKVVALVVVVAVAAKGAKNKCPM
jgi:hypothetical protein